MLAGIALAVGLIVYQGTGQVLGTLMALGWGFIPVVLIHVVQLLCSALGWQPLIATPRRPPLHALLKIRWIREGANGLLPVAHIGGEVISARLLTFRGVSGDVAGASVVVDLTAEVVTQFLFTLAGMVLLVIGDKGGDVLGDFALGLVIAAAALVGFVIAQRVGLFKLVEEALDRVMERTQWIALSGIKGLHDAIQEIHRKPRVLARSAFWHLLSWLLGALEVWAVLGFMGITIDLHDALILESMGQAAHSAGFAVPGAIGIQEGGLMLSSTLVGVAPEAALALSLAKRLRELVLGLPALAVWQYLEGRRLFRARAGANSQARGS